LPGRRELYHTIIMNSFNGIPIKGLTETSFLDWPGKIVSVIFLPFCNFRCPFCHNSSLIVNPDLSKTVPLPRVFHLLKEFEGWIDGVCITGGEPTLHKTLPEFIRAFKKKNYSVKLDTNGSNPRMIEALLREELIDCVAMDVKAPLNATSYSRLSGVPAHLNKIRESIDLIRDCSVEAIFRITVVPGMLTEEDIYQVANELYPAKKFVLQQFSPENPLDTTLKDVAPWPQEKMDRLQHSVNRILTGC